MEQTPLGLFEDVNQGSLEYGLDLGYVEDDFAIKKLLNNCQVTTLNYLLAFLPYFIARLLTLLTAYWRGLDCTLLPFDFSPFIPFILAN
jgi:hypothetical protein